MPQLNVDDFQHEFKTATIVIYEFCFHKIYFFVVKLYHFSYFSLQFVISFSKTLEFHLKILEHYIFKWKWPEPVEIKK